MTTSPFSFVGLSILAACFCLIGCTEKQPPAEPTVQTSNDVVVSAATGVVNPAFQKLAGKWERPDGGYVLHLKSVDAKGSFEAAYFNPDAINVSRAVAIQEAAVTKLFVELRDVNYPGCTYSLTYDPQTDQLYGQYYQAAAQQTYDVTFGRLKE